MNISRQSKVLNITLFDSTTKYPPELLSSWIIFKNEPRSSPLIILRTILILISDTMIYLTSHLPGLSKSPK